MKQKTVYLESLGCPKNLVDSEIMLGSLLTNGYLMTNDETEADLIVVNTCGFLESASQESIGRLKSLADQKKKGSCKQLVMAGCLVQRSGDEMRQKLPQVDLFIGTHDYPKLAKLVEEALPERPYLKDPLYIPSAAMPRLLTNHRSTYVKIAEGCNHVCSFCIIPNLRGKQRSRSIEDIVQETKNVLAQGVKEINLIAQDTTDYGGDLHNGTTIEKLMRALAEIPGDHWIRLMYAYPLRFTDELVQIMKESPTICKYIDIPLQHISDTILKSMKRGSDSRYIWRIVETLRREIPEMTIRSTFITGFPGETEADFEKLHDFIRQAELERVGIFPFSVEKGTVAATLPHQVPQKIAEERRDILMATQQEISLKKNKRLIGKTVTVLDDFHSTRLASQAPEIDGVVKINRQGSNTRPPEQAFLSVKITGADPYDLEGQLA